MNKRANNFKDLTNKRFGRLIVIEYSHTDNNRKAHWFCKCNCGNIVKVGTGNLKNGKTKSCGCLQKERVKEACSLDLTNKRFGKWKVLRKAKNSNWGTKWACICDCGVKRDVLTSNLSGGLSTNCGCYQREMNSKRRKGIKGKFHHTEEAKRLMSITRKGKYAGKDSPFYGRTLSEEIKEKISKALKDRYSVEKHHNIGKWGKDNPNWNSNLTNEDRQHTRTYPEYKDWRDSIFERDSYTCQVCNNRRGGNLAAHHIESYNSNKELRTTLSNGITLCKKCHMNFHHQYGYGDNTKKQFKEFLVWNKKQANGM